MELFLQYDIFKWRLILMTEAVKAIYFSFAEINSRNESQKPNLQRAHLHINISLECSNQIPFSAL